MEFKDWLITEKAERTSAKVPLYPVLYHTKQYTPLYHAPYAADYNTWLGLELEPFTWQNYKKIFGHDEPPKPNWPEIGFDIPAHKHTIPHPKKWEMP